MEFLLDTHSFLWFISGDSQLSTTSRNLIEDTANDIYVSTASLWEIAIKVSIGKLILEASYDELIPKQIVANSFELLPIKFPALTLVTQLPFHHRDPFDRLIISQAITSELPVISKDRAYSNYSVKLIW